MGTKTRDHANLNFQKLNNTLVDWQSVHVADGSTVLTAVAGRGYFINTTSGAQTVNLPSGSNSESGDTIQLKDYARTWGTNSVTMGSNTFDGIAGVTPIFDTNGQTVTLIYMDDTKGWSLINEDTTSGLGTKYIAATGGTVATSGDFKIHTFTGDGCFVVSCAGNSSGSNKVSYLVIAGGGGGGGDVGGGGGAGGYREGKAPAFDTFTASPIAAPDGLPVSASTYPITVGAGGGGNPGDTGPTRFGNNGSNSVFSTITSTGGGGAGGNSSSAPESGGRNGGSGGGGGRQGGSGGQGNNPPVSPPQGNNGGNGAPACGHGGGGGGATAVGTAGTTAGPGIGAGGAGGTSCITATPVERGGGGGAGVRYPINNSGTGPSGGGGGTGTTGAGNNASDNLGGGGGGGGSNSPQRGGSGGKGIVVIRYKFQN